MNRSTFYLHYETVGDLLSESVRYINDLFSSYMDQENTVVSRISDCSLEELHFVTPEYLMPYLRYIAEHKSLFRTMVQKSGSLGLDETYGRMFQHVFSPILGRFQVPEQGRSYLMSFFYIHGLMAIITEWLKNDCAESIDYMIGMICRCVWSYGRNKI